MYTRTYLIITYRSKLAAIFGVNDQDVLMTHVYDGCCCFGYTVSNSEQYMNVLNDPNIDDLLRNKFEYFESNRIHPSLFRMFNVNDFDVRGNKDFTSMNSSFEIGPANKKQTYKQPHGWTRYGLNVLNGKFGNDDTWLHPFKHNNNWYRAFHGVRNTGNEMDIVYTIHNNGFLPGSRQRKQNCRDREGRMVGKGVYCTPDIGFAESYSGRIALRLSNGQIKHFKMLFQVCVDPNEVRIVQDNQKYWIAPNEIGLVGRNPTVVDNIRAYGILLKEVQN